MTHQSPNLEGANKVKSHQSHLHNSHEHTKLLFRTELTVEPPEPKTGGQVKLVFVIKSPGGSVVRDPQIVHEKPMHLLVVSEDLHEFEHLHPEQQSDGSFTASHIFADAGNYILYADYTPRNASQVVDRHRVSITGSARARVPLLPDAELSKTINGLRFTLRPQMKPQAGLEVMLKLIVTDAQTGEPIKHLQPYLGAMAHFVVISQDTADFLHVHAMETHQPETSMNEIAAHTVFPRGGLYKLWAQVRRRGQVVTVPFVLNVKSTKAPDSEPEHRAHS